MEGRIGGITISDCLDAAKRAQHKHGPLTTNAVRACAILGREWGEAMNEALLLTVPGSGYNPIITARLYDELAQVAATAMLMMEHLKPEGVKLRREGGTV